ncbi:MAG: hypothetical protein OEW39_04995 [Deltaproteobacteria bacterium]|nr:hypothetical protein [Deltaproteobacteria bacterium]
MIKTLALWAGRIGFPLIFMVALIWLGRFPLNWASEDGMLRLAWRMVGTNIRLCRDYTEEERNRLPKHMQLKQHCTTSLLTYRLRVIVDQTPFLDKMVKPQGARGDRPLYVNEELSLTPGPHRIEVRFDPYDPSLGQPEPADPAGKAEQSALRVALTKASLFHLEDTIHIESRRIVLLDLNEDQKEFELILPPKS